ncbi:MAG: ABC transporter ATP-binding protein [Pseudomonadota bacterium]
MRHVRMHSVSTETNQISVLDWNLLRRLWRFAHPHRRILLSALALLPLASALHLLPPYLLKLTIDEAITPGRLNLVAPYALLMVGVLVLQQLAIFGHSLLTQICGYRTMHDLRVAAHRHLLNLSASFFDRTPVGRVMTRVTNDVESIAEAFASGLINAVGDAITLFGILAAMFWLDSRLALLTMLALPILVLVVLVFQRLLRITHRIIRRCVAQINNTLQEHILGMKVVQTLGREERAKNDFDKVNLAHRNAFRTAIKFDAALFALVEMLGSIAVAALLWHGGLRIVLGGENMTFGVLVAFIEYVQRFFVPIRDISGKYAIMQQVMAASERVFGLLDTNEPDCPSTSIPEITDHDKPGTVVSFRDVTFGYSPNVPVLKDISFSVSQRENIAIVGPTGSGKSTLVRLLTRLYEIQKGSIRVHGKDIRTLEPADLRQNVVVLGQDPLVFSGNIFTNITLDDPNISASMVQDIADQIGLSKLLPMNHSVLERGANLSAGERQLIVFARALARRPEILVLDEATANVDPASEQIIQYAIAKLMRKQTTIAIAHRLSTIEQADRVLVLHQGRLVEQGTHKELLAKEGLYSRLYQLQYVTLPI